MSAAEVLIGGVRRGRRDGVRAPLAPQGARAATTALLRRSFQLYRASVVVVALVWLLTLVPGLATDALTIAPRTTGPDLYDFDGPLRLLVAIVTLEAGPWQFNVLGFFIAALVLAPAVLWALARGWWPAVLAASWALFLAGRATLADVLPMQSEGPFPLLIWQVLFVHGMVLGWHRDSVARAVARTRGAVAAAIVAVALAAAYVRLHEIGLPARSRLRAGEWRRWDAEHFNKRDARRRPPDLHGRVHRSGVPRVPPLRTARRTRVAGPFCCRSAASRSTSSSSTSSSASPSRACSPATASAWPATPSCRSAAWRWSGRWSAGGSCSVSCRADSRPSSPVACA